MLLIKIHFWLILLIFLNYARLFSAVPTLSTSIHDLERVNQRNESTQFANKTVTEQEEEDEDAIFRFTITGGYRPEDKSLLKYLISIRTYKSTKYFGDTHICGGTIIAKKAVLTAAHCCYDENGSKRRASLYLVVAGTPKRLQSTSATQEVEVDKVKTHPGYSPITLQNDIAIFKLKKEIDMDDKFTAIVELPPGPPIPGKDCTVVGWGRVIEFGPVPDEAVFADMKIREYSFCKNIKLFSSGMLCAGDPFDFEVDSCHGDSGGPLMCDKKVVGIVSYGFGCGEPYSAGVYTDVDHYHRWVVENSSDHLKLNSFVTFSLIFTAFAKLYNSLRTSIIFN